jgi:hypothetical protein
MSVRIDHDKILFDCTVDGIRGLKDGTISLTLHTQEVNAEGGGALFAMNQRYLHCCLKFKEENFTEEDMDSLEDFNPEKYDIPKDISPSKRLRDKIFIRWMKLGKPGGDFNIYYINRIDKYLNHEQEFIDSIDKQ